MHCSPQLELAEGSSSFSCEALKTVNCTHTEVLSQAHKARSLYACGSLYTTSREKHLRPINMLKAAWKKHGGSWKGRDTITQTLREAFQTLAPWSEIPGASFYLSAGLRPAGTGRQAGTGRRHSRTLASSRTSRVEAERFLPPAGRRLTGRTRRPSAGVFNECSYINLLYKLFVR